jgi:hypothetical protein
MSQRYKATRGSDWFLMERTEAQDFECPHEKCKAEVGKTCVNERTGDEVMYPAHPGRLRLAREARDAAREQAEAEGRQP